MRRPPLLAASMLAVLFAAGCTSTQDVLEPSAIVPPTEAAPTADPANPATAATSAATTASTTAAPIASRTRLQIAPIVGASVEAAGPLTERLATSARARGISVAGSSDTTATHVLKGYFSTLSEGSETTVVYVWDVYDMAGNRVHRINGQQSAASSGGEGWAGVPATTMQAVADQTVDQIATWLGGQTG